MLSSVSSEPTRREQHLVSRGYQKNFADGTQIGIVDVSTGDVVHARRSIKYNWRAKDFLSVVTLDQIDDRLEKEFARDEKVILNSVRDIVGFREITPRQRTSLDRLAAIHLIRSHAFRDAHVALVQDYLPKGVLDLASSAELLEVFKAAKGRPPASGELAAIVAEQAEKFATSPDLLPVSVRNSTNAVNKVLAKWTIQLISVSEDLPGLVLADTPILHGRRKAGLFGFQDAGAVGDADLIIVPIHRHLAACYSERKLRDVSVRTKQSLNWINSLLIRGATKEVACHPEDLQHTTRLIRNLDRYPAANFDRAIIH